MAKLTQWITTNIATEDSIMWYIYATIPSYSFVQPWKQVRFAGNIITAVPLDKHRAHGTFWFWVLPGSKPLFPLSYSTP